MANLRMYHSTKANAARAILDEGFRDFLHSQMAVSGIWLSREIFTVNEGARGHTILEISLNMTEDELRSFAVIEDEEWDEATGEFVKIPGFEPYEWLLPAEILNTRATIRMLTDEENPYAGIDKDPFAGIDEPGTDRL